MDCRKYGTVIVILAMVLLAGCGRNSSEEVPVTPIVTAEPAVAPNTESTITNQSGDSKEGLLPTRYRLTAQGSLLVCCKRSLQFLKALSSCMKCRISDINTRSGIRIMRYEL